MFIPDFLLTDRMPNAPNFTYREFIRSVIATRHNIINMPDDEDVWKNLESLASNVLQPIRNKFGPIRILSGFRTKTLNKIIGGSDNSWHCFGCAADLEPMDTNIKLMDVVEFVHSNLEYRELIAEFFDLDGWVHVAYVKGLNKRKLKLKDSVHNYKLVSIDYLKQLYGGKKE